jgi:hypothetical protein
METYAGKTQQEEYGIPKKKMDKNLTNVDHCQREFPEKAM